ncbi:hypothetical protein D4764_22G0003930 [Takifugu flavidus]|uniref:Uncharacterized protein n=1 Tax=Takifugu flavidus TaxID=433684 RepID=A0A5C6NC92_9TELE|nr:hypothetical protein D4764_22G0003930 [Takifugu flavidus]
MVEQTRQPSRAVSLQAGPGGLNSGTQFDTNLSLRINDGAAQIFGRQLAVIGDQLDKEWAGRRPNWLPTGLHVLGPAYALTRTIYWHLQTHVWGYQGLAAAVKAWMLGTSLGKGMLRTHTWGAWRSAGDCGFGGGGDNFDALRLDHDVFRAVKQVLPAS